MASASSEPQEFVSPKTPLRERKARTKLNNVQSRDFFRMCAAIANKDMDQDKRHANESSNQVKKDLVVSDFLDATYQEKSPIFIAEKSQFPMKRPTDLEINTALKKWASATSPLTQQLNNQANIDLLDATYFPAPKKAVVFHGTCFSKEDISILLLVMAKPLLRVLPISTSAALNALDFHNCFKHIMDEQCNWPLVFWTETNAIAIHQARLFWSHRLRMKSRQEKGGAQPLVRYFHAALRTHELVEQNIDILYWLRFTVENYPETGDFIDSSDKSTHPFGLMSVQKGMQKYLAANNSAHCDPITVLLRLYSESLVA
jgi:hypothetical protein